MANPRNTTPPIGTSLGSWVRQDLRGKADQSWAQAKFEAVEKSVDETKRIVLRTKKKVNAPHICEQKESIDRVMNMVDGWSRWWRGTLISALGFVIVVGGSWLYQYFTLSADVVNTRVSVEELSISVQNIETSQEELKQAFDFSQDREIIKDKTRLSEVRSILKSVIQQELRTAKKKKKKLNKARGN